MQLIADIVPSLLHENSNFLCCCVIIDDRYVPYQPLQDKRQNALKACWQARVKKYQFHVQGHSCTLLFPCVNLCHTFTGLVPNCYCIHFLYCTVLYGMVPGLQVVNSICRLTRRKSDICTSLSSQIQIF